MFHKAFSHIYIEEEIVDTGCVCELLEKLPNAEPIVIGHYKDIFGRHGMDANLQNQYPQLILAKNREKKIYKGSPVCQSFGNHYFYYTSNVKNCIYHCEYCYLRGMYPCGHVVIFTNLEDTFEEVEKILCEHPVYLCVSYDTDLLALEKITGFLARWIAFCGSHPDLQIEIRTKCSKVEEIQRLSYILNPRANQKIIFAFTLSPDKIIRTYERGTPGLTGRLKAVKQSIECGFSTRLCFDPMIYERDYPSLYQEMISTIRRAIPDPDQLLDVSIGSFRISGEYLKNMRKNGRDSVIANFPYELTNGFYHYPYGLDRQMEQYLKKLLMDFLPEQKIFLWQEE